MTRVQYLLNHGGHREAAKDNIISLCTLCTLWQNYYYCFCHNKMLRKTYEFK